MKKRSAWILCIAMLLCFACGQQTQPAVRETPAQATEESPASSEPETPAAEPEPASLEEMPAAEPEPAASEETPRAEIVTPDLSGLPIGVNVYMTFGEYPTEERLFEFDLDFDGTPEEISFAVDYEAGVAVFRDGERTCEIRDVGKLLEITLIDLDPETPWANIMVVTESTPGNNMTFALHPEGNRLADYGFAGWCYWEDGVLIRDEFSAILGRRSGWCVCSGEEFTPDSDWRQDDYIPTEDEIGDEREDLIETGILLHTVLDLPCMIDGADTVLPKGTDLYVLRFSDALNLAEVKTTEGVVAVVSFTGDAWTSLDISEIPQEEYFERLPGD